MTRVRPVTSSQICEAIAATHAPPEWACFFEVGNATGYRTRRHADAVAMSIWPSRGLILRGFEVKVSRPDYKKERRDPDKAEAIAAYCDEWYLATPPGLIADIETELPPAWGLFELDGERLKTRRAATRTEAKPIDRSFLAAILRRAHEMTTRGGEWIRVDSIADRLEDAREQGSKLVPYESQRIDKENGQLKKVIEEFQSRTGIDINGGYSDGDVASCYRLGRLIGAKWGHDMNGTIDSLQRVRDHVERALSEIEDLDDKGGDKK